MTTNKNRLPTAEQREHLMVRVAKLYYDLERTQSEIAKELDLTRWQVGRLLTEAKEIGIVRIEIRPRVFRKTDLEVELQKKFNLKDAVVVPMGGTDDPNLLMESTAQAAAKYLAGLNIQGEIFGVSWGYTMSVVSKFLPTNWNPNVHVVLVNGSTNLRLTSTKTSAVAEEFAVAGNGTATLLPVPAIVGKKSTRIALEEDPTVKSAMTLAIESENVCFGMGIISNQSVLVKSGYINKDDIKRLKKAGAVGDILGRFIDHNGNIADTDINDRTVGLRLDELKSKKNSIGVVSGADKFNVAYAVLKAGYVSVIITDEDTAKKALKKIAQESKANG